MQGGEIPLLVDRQPVKRGDERYVGILISFLCFFFFF